MEICLLHIRALGSTLCVWWTSRWPFASSQAIWTRSIHAGQTSVRGSAIFLRDIMSKNQTNTQNQMQYLLRGRRGAFRKRWRARKFKGSYIFGLIHTLKDATFIHFETYGPYDLIDYMCFETPKCDTLSTLITNTLRHGPIQTDANTRTLHQETVRLRLSLAWVNTDPITSSGTLSIKRAHWRSQDLTNPQSHEVHVWNFPSHLKFIKGFSITPLESAVILECDFELLKITLLTIKWIKIRDVLQNYYFINMVASILTNAKTNSEDCV